ncbi:hypothetical protein LN650_18080 [Klebsiella pneumoniae subsp. pneumoniae]|nr:hypothetical protein [Klebsiella pneumoniae subsp. pneumoniae]
MTTGTTRGARRRVAAHADRVGARAAQAKWNFFDETPTLGEKKSNLNRR